MRRLIKVVVWVIAIIAVIVVAAVAFAYFGSDRKQHRTVDVNVQAIPIPTDEAALDRGQYLYESRGCRDCHGPDGTGKVVIDGDGFHVRAPAIAAGAGSVTSDYDSSDWVRAIRHGIKPNGEPILIMPSEDYDRLTDDDTGAIVAYIASLPSAAGAPAEVRLPLPVRLLYAVGVIQDAAEKIDHTLPPQQPIAATDVLALGAYVAETCSGCHNEALSGGKIAGGDPNWPPASNLTSGEGGILDRYPTVEALTTMFRSGTRPDGSAIAAMPFDALKEISDDDMTALHVFLKTLPAKKTGEL